jgi:sialidase-1
LPMPDHTEGGQHIGSPTFRGYHVEAVKSRGLPIALIRATGSKRNYLAFDIEMGDQTPQVIRHVQFYEAPSMNKMTRLALTCLTTAISVASAAVLHAAAPKPLIEKQEIFPWGKDGFAVYRIPGIVVTPKGSVLVYCEARKYDRYDFGEIEVHMRRSIDGGKTWEPARQIAHLGERIEGNPRKKTGGEHEQTVNNPMAIVDRQTGAVEFLYCVNYHRCFSMHSTDDGVTWSKPVDITATFEPFRAQYDWKVIATGPGHGIQLTSGRLVVPVWLAWGGLGDHSPTAAGTIFSDDHGRTWQAGDIAVPNEPPFKDPNETMITQLSDGKVLLITRSVSAPSRKLITRSPDGARHWSRPVFHPDLWEPICMASIVAYPSQPGTLVFSNPHHLDRDKKGQEIPGAKARRKNLTIKLSRDDGQTWPVSRSLEPGTSGYSDLAVLPDGTLLCFYELKDRMAVAHFNLQWLTAGGTGANP